MGWVYLDDNFPTHPKVVAAMAIDPLAPWLYVCGLAYCRKYLKGNGMIHHLVVPTLSLCYRPKMRAALLDPTVGLWEQIGSEWIYIHDYEMWNKTEDAHREARTEKASKAASARWELDRVRKISGGVNGG